METFNTTLSLLKELDEKINTQHEIIMDIKDILIKYAQELEQQAKDLKNEA